MATVVGNLDASLAATMAVDRKSVVAMESIASSGVATDLTLLTNHALPYALFALGIGRPPPLILMLYLRIKLLINI